MLNPLEASQTQHVYVIVKYDKYNPGRHMSKQMVSSVNPAFSPIRSSCSRVKYHSLATLSCARYSSMEANLLADLRMAT